MPSCIGAWCGNWPGAPLHGEALCSWCRPPEPFGYHDTCFEVVLPDDATALQVLQHSVLVRFVHRVWGSGTTLEEAMAAAAGAGPGLAAALAKPHSVKVDVTCTHPDAGAKAEVAQRLLEALQPGGPVNARHPETRLVLQFCSTPTAGLERGCAAQAFLAPGACSRVRLLQALGESSMPALEQRLTLKKRPYLGPTSLDPHLAMLMCSLAGLVGRKAPCMVLDPFSGTGSLLVTAAAFGNFTLGAEIDVRVLVGKGGRTLQTNFDFYGMGQAEQVRGDNSSPPFRQVPTWDAIVTDPPYSIRAAARKSGSADPVTAIPAAMRDGHIPKTQVYRAGAVMQDLLDMAARCLVLGGRLAYLLPSTVHYRDEELPVHPCLTLRANAEQQLGLVLTRRCVVMEKTAPYEAAREGEYAQAAADAQAAAAALGVDCDSIATRIEAATRAQHEAAASGQGAAVQGLSARQLDVVRKRAARRQRKAAAAAARGKRGRAAAPAGAASDAPPSPPPKRSAAGAGGGDAADAPAPARGRSEKYDSHLLDPAAFADMQRAARCRVAEAKAANGGVYRAFGGGPPPLHVDFSPWTHS